MLRFTIRDKNVLLHNESVDVTDRREAERQSALKYFLQLK